MSINFIPDIPAAQHSPSQDQPDMQTNTNAELAIWDIDHVTFNSLGGTSSGRHKKVTFEAGQSVPGLSASQLQVYPKTFGAATTYLETFASLKPSAGNQIDGYVPFVKGMVQFTIPLADGVCTLNTTNTLNFNIASVTKTSNDFDVVFTTSLPYNTYYVFIFNADPTATGTNSTWTIQNKLTTGFRIHFSTSAIATTVVGFMVI